MLMTLQCRSYAHDTLTAFMEKKGWNVEKNYHLDTAWVATFSNGNGGRVLGVNSEMDALPGIGHACGHNLIAIAGVAVALAVKAALIEYEIPGKIILLGTPGLCSLYFPWSGVILKYDNNNSGGRRTRKGHPSGKGRIQGDACMLDVRRCSAYTPISYYTPYRCHPAPGPEHGASLSSSLSLQRLSVEYRGHTYVV